jgi:hypothetical protein
MIGMLILFILLVGLIIALAVGIGFLVWGFIKKNMVLKLVGTGITIPLVSLGLLITYALYNANQPESIFEDAFRELPTEGITNLKTQSYGFADSSSTFIQFNSPKEEFLRLAPKNLAKVSSDIFEKEKVHTNVPEWWTLNASTNGIYFGRVKDFDGTKYGTPCNCGPDCGFGHEDEWYIYNPDTRQVNYSFIGVD